MKAWRGVVFCFWGLVACAALYAPVVSAQFSEFTGFGGLTLNHGSNATAGVAVALNISPQMALEGEVGVIFADDKIITANGNVVMNLGYGTSLVVPYLTGGAGLMHNGGTEIALNAGGGFKLFVEPMMAFRGDFRVFLTTEGGDVQDLERFYAGIDMLF